MKNYFEKLNEFSGIAEVEYRGENFYVVYLEESLNNMGDYFDHGYLGKAISKGKSVDEALRNAIKSLSKRLAKYSVMLDQIFDVKQDLENIIDDPDLDDEGCGLGISLGEYLEELKDKNPRNKEEKDMWEHESDARVWLTENKEPYLNPYP